MVRPWPRLGLIYTNDNKNSLCLLLLCSSNQTKKRGQFYRLSHVRFGQVTFGGKSYHHEKSTKERIEWMMMTFEWVSFLQHNLCFPVGRGLMDETQETLSHYYSEIRCYPRVDCFLSSSDESENHILAKLQRKWNLLWSLMFIST